MKYELDAKEFAIVRTALDVYAEEMDRLASREDAVAHDAIFASEARQAEALSARLLADYKEGE